MIRACRSGLFEWVEKTTIFVFLLIPEHCKKTGGTLYNFARYKLDD
jgi:hypothetical protein